MAYYDDEKHIDPETGDEFFFYKNHKRDKVWWVDYPNVVGNLAVSFDKKNIIHLFKDYPWKLTNEQKKQFDKENPYWADFFKDRNGPPSLTGKIQKIKIHSNSISFGLMPRPDDEVEQHLSIIRDGRVFFTSYVFGDGIGRYKKNVTRNFKADPEKVQRVMAAFEEHFSKGHEFMIVRDVGEWTMEIMTDAGDVFSFKGSLLYDSIVEETVVLSKLVRDELGMANLYVFDGNYNDLM